MSLLVQQKAKQDGVFAKALREASNAFVQMGAHPRTLLHHSRRSDLIEQVITKLHILKREGDAYHQLGQPAEPETVTEPQNEFVSEPVGFRKADDVPVAYSALGFEVQSGGLNRVLNNPYGQAVKYTSGNEAVATVDERTGVITPVGHGEVTIYVALTKKGDYPRVEDSVSLVIEDAPQTGTESSPSDDTQTDSEASKPGESEK